MASESEEESDKEADKRSSLRKLLLAGSDDEGEADDGGRDAFFMNDGSSDEERSVEDPTADFEDGWGAAGSQHDDEVVHEVCLQLNVNEHSLFNPRIVTHLFIFFVLFSSLLPVHIYSEIPTC